MSAEKNFTDRSVFEDLLAQIPTARGGEYQDIRTIYGDMSRLAVAFFATTPPEQLQEIYNNLGWAGSANVRAVHATANRWYQLHHPSRLARTASGGGAA